MGEKIIRKVKGMSWTAKVSLMLVFTLMFSIFMYYGWYKPRIEKAEAASGDVILLWDTANGAVPGGWTSISGVGGAFYGVFPRAAASYGAATAGADTHTHTLNYSSTTGPSATVTTLDPTAGADEATSPTHTHTWGNITSGAGDVRPPFKNLVFIRATNPVTIPANAIGIFDTGSLPSGWTRYAALDGNYLRGFSDNLTGGAATHTHTTTVTSAAAAVYIADSANTTNVARSTHTHDVSGSLSTLGTNAQPYVEVVFAYNSSGGAASIPTGLIAMFDAAPTGNWATVSGVAPWTGNFLKGATSYGTTGGSSVDHNHGASQVFTSGVPSATRTIGAAGARTPASPTHTHGVTYLIANSGNPLPVYRDTIFAKYTAPAATTTLADGTNPSSVTIAPGAAITDLDAFTLQTSAGTDTVTAVVVTLGPAGAFNNIAQVDITDNSNLARCTAVTNPVSNTITFPGGTCTLNGGIPVIAASPTTYKVRITPKTHALMPVPPGASYATTGTVTSFTSTNAQAGTDSGSATITIDNLSPNGATATSGTAGNQKVTINWTTSNSGDFNATSGSVIYRWAAGSAGAEVPAEGSAPAIGSANGTATAACVVSSAASTALSKIDGTGGSAGECTTAALTNGQQYTYKAFQKDTNGNYDVGVSIGTFTPTAPATTTIADGTNPSSVTIAPGAAITDLDAFTLQTSAGTDTVTAVVVTLGPAGAFNNIAQVDITDNSNLARCTAVSNPVSNTITFPGGTCTLNGGIPVIAASPTTYKVRITPKTHALMPVPPGASYATTGTVTSFTSTNAQAGTDSGSATITIDNLSPNGATATSGTAGNQKVTINWTTSSSSDFNATSGSVIYRWAAGSAGAEVPAEGSAPAIGSTNGTATAACVVSSAASTPLSKIDGSGGSAECTNVALTNGQQYTYKAFQKDTNGNYDVGVSIGTFTPAAACTRNQPSLDLSPNSGTITTDGGNKVYTLTIMNNDSGCTSTTFNLSKTDSNSTNFNASVLSQNSVALNSGESNNSITVTVYAKSGETTGTNNTYVTSALDANHAAQNSDTVATNINIVNMLLHNSVVTGSTKWGSAWGIAGGKYGEFTCGTCHAPRATNIKGVKSTVTAPASPAEDFPGGAGSSVNFQSFTTSATDMGNDSGNSPRASSTRICEVCHTYDVTQVSGVNAHPYSVGGALTNHYSADNTDCTSCHKHNVGFKGMGCDSCHGNPPTDTSSGGPTGLANAPGPTGSTTAGAHLAHVTTLSFACGNCHYGYSMPESPKQIIDIGFSMWTKDGTGTTYGAADEVNAADDYRGTNGTTIVDDNTRNCSNLYCHGNFTGGLNATPTLTGTAVCGTCHANDVASAGSLNNSHPRHAGSGAGGISVACADCHNNGTAYILKNGHVNGKIAWSLKTGDSRFSASAKYNGAASGEINNVAPSASYQTCTNVYCHSNVQNGTAGGGPTSYGTPTWGAASVSCSQGVTGCHGNAPATPTANDAHGMHTTGSYSFTCSACHNNGGDESANHANGTLNMTINATYGGTYSQGDHTPGSGGYGTCATVYCHGNYTGSGGASLTPSWAVAVACGDCHKYLNTNPPTPGNHGRHAGQAAGQLNLTCANCHEPARVLGDGHVNLSVQWNLDRTDTKIGSTATYKGTELGATGLKAPSAAYGNCGSVYCHSSVQSNPGTGAPASYATPTWGAVSVTCDSCHGQGAHSNGQPSTGSHEVHVTGYTYACAVCHTGHGDETATHANRTINLAFDAATAGGSAAYTGDTVPQSGAFGNCNTTFCHGDSSNTSAEVGNWGTSLSASDACTVCHGTKTTAADGGAAVINRAPGGNATGVDTNGDTAATDAQVGAHDTHLSFLNSYSEGTTAIPNMCNECHTIPAATVAGIKGHFLDGTPAELTWGTRATFNTATPSYASSICSGTYCHGAKMPAGSTGGSDTSPLWTDTAYLTGTPTLAGDCGKCHASPPATSSHTGSETIADCNACHPHVNVDGSFNDLTKHVDGIMQATGDCVGCHAGIKGTRRAVVGEFGLAWGHKKTGRGAVTPADCCVCHLEGNSTADPTPSGVHNNGVINLKNPDTGGALTTFASFTRNTASNSLEAAVTNVQNNLCLKCHDADGALSASARVSGGTATNPWNDGATMVNVDAHFTTTNASYHPVKGTQNNDYCDSVTMVAPWNGITKTKGTKTAGYQISCFDCHNAGAELASGSVTAHGNAVTLRATYNRSASAATALCIECHKTTVYSTGATSTGSAFDGSTGDASHSYTGSKMVESNFGTGGCLICHSSLVNGPARPTRAQDAHGFPGGTYTSGAKQYSFLRETALFTNWQAKSGGGTGTPTCWINPTNDGAATCQRNSVHVAGGGTSVTYTPGGSY